MISLFIAAILVLLYFCWPKSKFHALIDKAPGPLKLPFIGNLHILTSEQEKLFKVICQLCQLYRETFRIWIGPVATMNLMTPEDIEIIMSSTKYIDKSVFYNFMHPWLGTGLLTSTGSKWQKRRKILTPAFHFSILKRFQPIFGEHSLKLVANIHKECKKGNTDVIPLIKESTLHVICETAMGKCKGINEAKQSTYYDAINRIALIVVQRSLSPWLYSDFIFKLTPLGWRNNKDIKILHDFSNEVIKEREKNFKPEDVDNLDEDDYVGKKRLAMLDLLLLAKKNNFIDNEGIREEVDTFMFEGHDTTAMALIFSIFALACYKECQDKAYEELNAIFGTSDRTPTYQDLQEMKYLEMCIKETLRLYPSVPFVSRELKENAQLTKCLAPAGCIINIHIFNLHRNPTVFPEPEKFDPDRFLPENIQGRHPYAYIPFSAGPRNCIGQKFAMMELKTSLSAVLRNFKIESVSTTENLTLLVDLVLRNKDPIYVKFIPRN